MIQTWCWTFHFFKVKVYYPYFTYEWKFSILSCRKSSKLSFHIIFVKWIVTKRFLKKIASQLSNAFVTQNPNIIKLNTLCMCQTWRRGVAYVYCLCKCVWCVFFMTSSFLGAKNQTTAGAYCTYMSFQNMFCVCNLQLYLKNTGLGLLEVYIEYIMKMEKKTIWKVHPLIWFQTNIQHFVSFRRPMQTVTLVKDL